MPFSRFLRLPLPSQIPRFLRQVERDVETVIDVLQPGPLGIVEHKFSAAEMQEARAVVTTAVETWRQNAASELAKFSGDQRSQQ